jgi:hypothetical protein
LLGGGAEIFLARCAPCREPSVERKLVAGAGRRNGAGRKRKLSIEDRQEMVSDYFAGKQILREILQRKPPYRDLVIRKLMVYRTEWLNAALQNFCRENGGNTKIICGGKTDNLISVENCRTRAEICDQ